MQADEAANARLAAILARSLDRSDCLLLRHVDGARMMLWVAERGRRCGGGGERGRAAVEGALRCLARAAVKFIHEHAEWHRDFGANVKRMAAAMASGRE